MLTATQATNKFFAPQATREPERPEFDQASAGAALRDGLKLDAKRAKLRDAEAAAVKALEQAQNAYREEMERIRGERVAVDTAASRSDRARAWLIGNCTSEPAEERDLRELTQRKLIEAGQLNAQSGVHAASMLAVEETAEFRELQAIDAKLAELAANGRLDYESFDRYESRSLAGKAKDLAQQVDAYRKRYATFREIAALKAEAKAACEKREQLQRARHEAVIADAIKAASGK